MCERVCLMRDQRGNRLLLRVSFGRRERIKVDLEGEKKEKPCCDLAGGS